MNTKSESPLIRTILILTLIAICAALRLAPHPWNFTPIGAMAIFAGAMIRNRPWAFLFPLLAMFATDLIIGFNVLSPLVYASFSFSVLISRSHASRRDVDGARLGAAQSERSERVPNPNEPRDWRWAGTIARLGAATFLGSLQFFLVTNFGVWAFLDTYPRTAAGLAACYLAGLPLFLNTLTGDFTYMALLLGALALAMAVVQPRASVST